MVGDGKWTEKRDKLLQDNPDWLVDTAEPADHSCFVYSSTGFVVDPVNMETYDSDDCTESNGCPGHRLTIEMISVEDQGYIETPISFAGLAFGVFDDTIESFKCGKDVKIELCN